MTSPTTAPPSVGDAVKAAWRKTVAVAVGAFLTYLMRRGHIILDADSSQALVMGVVAVATAIYGAIINFLELKVPQLGWFLGLAKRPKFVESTPTVDSTAY